MIEHLTKYKKAITDFLTEYLRRHQRVIFEGTRFGHDVAERLLTFSLQGKMIRGSLVYMGAGLYGHTDDDPALLRMAAVMELLQSFLLIHDDIMDRDRLRRGAPSIYAQYEELGREEGIRDNLHFGEAMGICTGDVAIFLATGLIADESIPDEHRRSLLSAVSNEISRVGLAQMGDVYHGVSPTEIDEDDVINVYRLKTGRYTFSLPLCCGAILADAPKEELEALGRIGEGLGIVFQIKDDDIGLFGTTEGIGKTVGSDISEDKKTLHRIELFQRVSETDRAALEPLFGAGAISTEQVDYVLEAMRRYGIDTYARERMRQFADHTADMIRRDLRLVTERGKQMLESLLEYNLTRSQ